MEGKSKKDEIGRLKGNAMMDNGYSSISIFYYYIFNFELIVVSLNNHIFPNPPNQWILS